MSIDATTRICAVIGWPIEHSLSPAIHNAAFEAARLNFAYVGFAVRPGELAGVSAGIRALGIRGLSVTIPHKVDILPHLDQVEDLAARIGSVNTVLNDQGQLRGYSTDGPGALAALRAAGVDPCGRSLLLLGSGGAARAIAFTLAWEAPPSKIRILGIVADEVEQLRRDLQDASSVVIEGGSMGQLAGALEEAEIIVHASPIGMFPKTSEALIEESSIRADQSVFDVVYNPFETELLKRAKRAGARVVPGLGMFVQQAALQFRLWTGVEAPLETMEGIVRRALGGDTA